MLNPAFTPALLRSIPNLMQEEEESRLQRIAFKMLKASATGRPVTEWFYIEPSDNNERYVKSSLQPFIDQGFNVLIEPEHGRYKVTISWELSEGEPAVSHTAVCSLECSSVGHSLECSSVGHSLECSSVGHSVVNSLEYRSVGDTTAVKPKPIGEVSLPSYSDIITASQARTLKDNLVMTPYVAKVLAKIAKNIEMNAPFQTNLQVRFCKAGNMTDGVINHIVFFLTKQEYKVILSYEKNSTRWVKAYILDISWDYSMTQNDIEDASAFQG